MLTTTKRYSGDPSIHDLAPKLCHHCGQVILWNTCPDKTQSHWAHAVTVYAGKAHTLANALMEQRCSDGIHWAIPLRAKAKGGAQ